MHRRSLHPPKGYFRPLPTCELGQSAISELDLGLWLNGAPQVSPSKDVIWVAAMERADHVAERRLADPVLGENQVYLLKETSPKA